MKWPSLKNENALTWECKLFGCKDEELPLIFDEVEERHGVKNYGPYTAISVCMSYKFRGCMRCLNFRKILDRKTPTFPIYRCSCDVCDQVIEDNK